MEEKCPVTEGEEELMYVPQRRRTQIRLAQRAYRERKETTISGLENCVADMQRTIDEMKQIFLDFKDRAISYGITSICPALGEELETATQRFVKLSDSDRHEPSTTDCPDKPQGTTNNTGTVIGSPEVKRSQSPSLPDRADPLTDVRTTTTVWGYQVSLEPSSKIHNNGAEGLELGSTRENSSNAVDPKSPGNSIYKPRGRASTPESFIYTPAWNAEADRSLTSDYTYSFQESTFARRLLRSSYERACRLLLSPEANHQTIRRTLRYSLCLGEMEHIKARVDQTLKRTRQDSLEHWDVPALHIGGAGLHYPRLSMDGEAIPPETWANSHSTRPFLRRPSAIPVRDEEFPDHLVELADIEGVWLDPNDVEQYLKTKGLHLDGQCSIAEIEVDDPVPGLVSEFPATSPQSPTSGDLKTPHSPRSTGESFLGFHSHNGDYFSDRTTGSVAPFPAQFAPDLNIDFAFTTSWMNNDLDKTGGRIDCMQTDAMFPDMVPMAQWPRRKKLMIDVDKLMTGKKTYHFRLTLYGN